MLNTHINVHGTINAIEPRVSKQGKSYDLCKFSSDDGDRVTAMLDDDLDVREGETGTVKIEITVGRFTSAKIIKFMPD